MTTDHFALGERIAFRIVEVGMTKAELGRRINTSRQNVSLILAKAELSSQQIWNISKVLQFNLFAELAEQFAVENDMQDPKNATQIDLHLRVPDPQLASSVQKLLRMFSQVIED